jgi:hypothetical protein
MSGHTGGPWVAKQHSYEAGEWRVYAHGVGGSIAQTVSNVDAESEDANARLIAAAPDLLQCLHETSDALRALVYACETEGWTGQQALAMWKFAMAHNADLEDRVNAAIAKAEGR